MRKRTILEYETFKQIISYKSVIGEKDNEQRNKIKMDMLNSVINCIGIEKWQRMKPDTKHALEYLTFLSIERGFVWCSPEHVSERYTINSITVRRYVSFLEKQGIVSRLWRSSIKHNGRGCMVVFFHAHPYYEKYWNKRFFLSDDVNSNDKAESIENTHSINENDRISDSTISKPDLKSKDLKERSKDDLLDYVHDDMRNFAELYGCYFSLTDGKVAEYWRMAKLAAYKNCQENSENKFEIILHGFKQMIGAIKLSHRKIKNPIAYFYKICLSLFHDEYIRGLDEMGFWDKAPEGELTFEIPYD